MILQKFELCCEYFCGENVLVTLLKLEKLDTDLKNYKSNSIKESIRRGHDDLGDHYLDCGDLSNALKCYSRARDYCTSGKHVVNMCLNVIKVCM
jgi:COP9 signalosome complex subunit 1